MLNIAKIKDGLVIDHIKAGEGIRIFNWLGLDKAPYTSAFIVNAVSRRMGHKDIIKIDNAISINFDVLGLIDPNITVNVIQNEQISRKIHLELPEQVENVLRCKNPRCITSSEHYIPHIFRHTGGDKDKPVYRCIYCDEEWTGEI
jgi:aspartate carbamoyltransferase regulatory subunit